MAIISPLTYTIANGQAIDATPLMADLNQIVGNVNANAAGLSQSNTYASGTTQNFSSATTTVSASVSGTAQPVPRNQADNLYAALAGLSTQLFSAANGTTGNQVVNIGQFPTTSAANGSIELPSGIVVKWGSFLTVTGGFTSVTFNSPFPTNCWAVVGSPQISSQFGAIFHYTSLTTSGFSAATTDTSNAYVAYTVTYIAIGN